MGETWNPTTRLDQPIGAGRSERCVEVPWAGHWVAGRREILDIGFSLSDLGWLRTLLGQTPAARITAVDIIKPERVANRYPDDLRDQALATPVVIGDVRTVDLPQAAFDVVTCISTIEHVGFDAAGSTAASAFARWDRLEDVPKTRDPAVTGQVMAAFARALKPGGLALITVPMGQGGAVPIRDSLGFYTAQLEYDASTWPDIAGAPGFKPLEQRFFGWQGEGGPGWLEVDGPADLTGRTAWLTPHAMGLAVVALERV